MLYNEGLDAPATGTLPLQILDKLVPGVDIHGHLVIEFDHGAMTRGTNVPAHGAQNQPGLRLSPLEHRQSDCLLHDLFRLPVAIDHSCNTTARVSTSTVNRSAAAAAEHVSASGNGRHIIDRRRDLPPRVEPVLLKELSA